MGPYGWNMLENVTNASEISWFPAHILLPYFCKIHYNIILPPIPRCSE
jgi:hypothetical protein